MDEYLDSAVQTHRKEIIEALSPTVGVFLAHLDAKNIISSDEGELVNEKQTSKQKLLKLLDIIRSKDRAWTVMIKYLKKNNHKVLANSIEEIANQMQQGSSELKPKKTSVSRGHQNSCKSISIEKIPKRFRYLILIGLLALLCFLWYCGNYVLNESISTNRRLVLSDSRDLITAVIPSEINPDLVEKFTKDLIRFYLGDYRAVESFGGENEPIESVWVDLQLERSNIATSNYDQIFAHMKEKNYRIALVQGQPGSGKTTLVKKIAYDWAKQMSEQKGKQSRFDLVLAVPLRSAKPIADPLQMAVAYTAEVSKVEQITTHLRHSNMKILVILDGLDEWKIDQNSSLSKIIQLNFNGTRSTAKIDFDFDIMITSRPYTSELINENLLVANWKIAGITQKEKLEFVQKRCRTEGGRRRALAYIQTSAASSQVAKVPLLLLLICYMADQNIKVPVKLTGLYDAFVLQMLIRSDKKGKTRRFDQRNWRKSELVASLGRLALLGVVKNKFEFSRDEMEMCRIKEEEAFKSGLLMFRSDPVTLTIKADFAHRSIQEFLSALHCVDFWAADSTITSTTGWPKETWPIGGISEMKVEMLVAKMNDFGDSQFCRFYFGVLSSRQNEAEFEVKMRKSLEEYVDIYLIVPHFLFCLSNSLADCSDKECSLTGKIVNNLVDKCFHHTKSGLTEVQLRKRNIFEWTEEKTIHNWPDTATAEVRPRLQSGLKLKWFGNSFNSFYLRSENQSELKMIRIWLDEGNLAEKVVELGGFEQVEWLWVSQSASSDVKKVKFAFEQIKRLPKCRNCRITDYSADYFRLRLWLGRKSEFPVNSGHSGVNPEFIYFRVERSLGKKILTKLSSLRQSESGEVEIESIEKINEGEDRGAVVRLAVSSSSWSVWDFLLSEAEWS